MDHYLDLGPEGRVAVLLAAIVRALLGLALLGTGYWYALRGHRTARLIVLVAAGAQALLDVGAFSRGMSAMDEAVHPGNVLPLVGLLVQLVLVALLASPPARRHTE